MSTGASDFNLHRLFTKELGDMLRATIQFGGNSFVFGQRGTGKTFIVRDVVKSMGIKATYWNCSVFERPDAGGMPKLLDASNSDYISYLLPYYFKNLIEGDEKTVLFMDELDKAPHDVVAPLLEIFQFRTINGRPLKNVQAIIAAGNLIAEGSSRPALPLLDRCEKYLVESNTTQWLDWACNDGRIHPSITAYINDHGNDLHGDVDPGDVYANPTPRGWHMYSDVLNFGEKHRWSSKILADKAAGFIGKKVGIKYAAYFDHYQVLVPLCNQIMEGKAIKDFGALEPGKQCVACMIVCSRVARLLDEGKDNKKKGLPREVDTVGKFMTKVDPELALVSIRSQIGLERTVEHDLDSHELWGGILTELSKRIRQG